MSARLAGIALVASIAPLVAGIAPLVAALALGGCAAWQTASAPTPTSYHSSREQIPRTVGKLRRLALLPVHQAAPRACGSSNGELGIAPALAHAHRAAAFLSERKGYEVIVIDADRYPAVLAPERSAELLHEVAAWSASTRADAATGPLLHALIHTVAAGEHADGLLVFHVHDSCMRAFEPGRVLLGIGSLGISELWPDPKLQVINSTFRVSIVESASARPVWRKVQRPEWKGTKDYFSLGRVESDLEALFAELEPAVPKILTR